MHAHTPTIATIDPRGLTVRSLSYCRGEEHQDPELRVTRHSYDHAGHPTASQDPRLPTPNQNSVYSLNGQVLLTDSVDAGWRVTLPGEAEQLLSGWDGRGSQRQVEYDDLLRPVLIREATGDSVGATGVALQQGPAVERLTYGGPQSAEHNQCNQLIRHDDTAGTVHHPDYSVLGAPLSEVRHFLRELNLPDWPLPIAERDALVEANGLESGWAFNALGEVIEQTDAMGNARQFKHTVAGQLKSVALGGQVLLSDINYNAFDQVEQQTAGNGVISRSLYDPQTGRLSELSAALPDAPPVQHFKYSYDPVGNIEQIEDAAQPVHFFANQRIDPISRYRYDTLYQLIEATGREVKTGASHGPALPDLHILPPDPNQIANYTQSYEYDAGGNLLKTHHVGDQPFTRLMRVAPGCNRSLPADEVDVDFEDGFDANGNLLQLVRGQDLSWDARNQLRHITTVQRDDGPSDDETYIYNGAAQRCRKIRSAQTRSRTLINEVRYLPGLEIRSSADGEVLHVVIVNNVRMLHWLAGKPNDIANDQLRYSLNDHLGSTTLELDDQGGLVSQEIYYPFGGTAWWAASGAVEVKYKTVRYSGKERDASGLYYYGFRYYAPWLLRWINPDPAGAINGLNIFCFTANSPLQNTDTNGLDYEGLLDETEINLILLGIPPSTRGLGEFSVQHRDNTLAALKKTTGYLENALKMIHLYPEASSETMRTYFGYEHPSVKKNVITAWNRTHQLSMEYQYPKASGKFVGFLQAQGDPSAFVVTSDVHGRIFMNTHTLDHPFLPLVIGHELSHLGSVKHITTTGPRTRDYYYLESEHFNTITSGYRISQDENIFRAGAKLITGGGLTPANLLNIKYPDRFIDTVNSFHSAPPASDLQTATSVFNRNPHIIASMSSENADSLIHAAHDLHVKYRSIISNQPGRSRH
nr:RHS repeat-associated core domain-containing protein [Pseudomonas sp. S25]